ncbi:MAG: hypothetical protein HY841_07650 [Bacteroidetes bacterium]|nr:hypothetical protein [Bacteroidota bacterium]
MKNSITFQGRFISHFYLALVLLFVSVFVLMNNKAMSQDKKEESSKLSVIMNVSSKISDGIKTVKVQVSRKENKKLISVEDLKSPVTLYLNEVKKSDPADGTGLIGSLMLNEDGEGVFEFPEKFNKLTSALHEFTFIAKIESDPVYDDAEEEITISDAKIEIKYSGEDSIKTTSAILYEWKDSAFVPVPEAELKLSIKRTFSLFPIGEEGAVTDGKGELSAELPLDIPGNPDGTITIVASVIDHETYGTVESTKKVEWNVLPKMNEAMGRTLWSTAGNAPIPLVIACCSIIAVIWGTLFYLIFQLVKIKKLGKQTQ